MTPNGHAGTQYPQPLQTSSWTTTVPNSVRISAPVGHTSRQAASVQCLHTSLDISQRTSSAAAATFVPLPGRPICSMNATCRQVDAPSRTELSYDIPVSSSPSSGTEFHSLQATSQALQPMQIEVSVKNPIRGGWSTYPAAAAGSRPARAVSPVRPAGSPVISRLRPPLVGDARPLLVVADPLAPAGPAGAASRPGVAGEAPDP